MPLDLAHIALNVHNLDRSLAFYAQFGLHEAFRLHHDDGTLMLVYLHVGGDRFIELFPGGPVPEHDRSTGHFAHLCLRVDDLQATVEGLRALNVTIDIPPTLGRDHNWQAWTHDPDGNRIELMQLSENSPQRRVARGEPATADRD